MVDKNNSGLNMIPDHNPQDNQSFVTTKNLSFQARIPPFDSESIFKIGCVGKFELWGDVIVGVINKELNNRDNIELDLEIKRTDGGAIWNG